MASEHLTKDEITAVRLSLIGGELTLLVDYGCGLGVLCDDGKIRWVGEVWLRERQKPRRMGRYRMTVNPWGPNL